MELTHTAYDHFLRLLVDIYAESWVFSFELGKSFLHLHCTVVLAGLDGETHHRVRDEHRLTFYVERVVCLCKGVTSGALDSKYSENVASSDFLDLFHIVCMQLNYS